MKRRDVMCFVSVRIGKHRTGLFLFVVFVSSRVQRDRGEAGLDSGIRNRVDCWVHCGAFRYSGGTRRWGGRRGRQFHLQKKM